MRKLSFLILFSVFFSFGAAFAFSGSASFRVDQRFFNDDRLGNVNGFSEWWAPEWSASFGLVELYERLEWVAGFSFISNTATACVTDSSGEICVLQNGQPLASEDRFKYKIFSFSTGLQYRAWSQDFFFVSPYTQVLAVSRYANIKKKTFALNETTSVDGIEIAPEFLGGLWISFFGDPERRETMKDQWGLKDFGMTLHLRYSPALGYRSGLGSIKNTGGWSFGTGLVVDW